MRWAGHVARMGDERGVYRVLVGKAEGRNHWGDLGVDGWKILGQMRMIWAGHVARMCDQRGVYRVLVGKAEGRRPLGRPRRRWVDNIRMDLNELGWACGAYG